MIENIKTIITHDKCSDGSASAIILHHCYPNAEIKFVSHGPQKDALEPSEGMLWCDICPDEEYAQKFIDAGAWVLDHHKGMKDVVARFGDKGIFADEKSQPGVSGALLAYSNCWRLVHTLSAFPEWDMSYNFNDVAKMFAEITGVYDTWQQSDPRWQDSILQAKALSLLGNKTLLATDLHTFFYQRKNWMDTAAIVQKKEDDDIANMLQKPYTYKTDSGYKVAVFPSTQLINGLSEGMKDQADIVMGFNFECNDGQPFIKISMRLTKTLDKLSADEFMKELGGGGHSKAAGAMIRLKTYSDHPYQYIYGLTYFL